LAQNLEETSEAVAAPPEALTWRVYLAFLFATFLILPAFIYYNLITNQYLTLVTWIPIVLWSELSNLLRARLFKQELFLLLAFQPISLTYGFFFLGLVRYTFYAYSEASSFFGIVDYIPDWFVPTGSALADVQQSSFFFLHTAWLVPIGLQILVLLLGLMTELVIGYLSYQIFAVAEKLEFPARRAEVAAVQTLVERNPSYIRPLFLSALGGIIVHLAGKFLPFMIGPFMTGGLVLYVYNMPYFDVTPYLDSILPGAAFMIPLDPMFYVPGFLLPVRTTLTMFIGAFALYFVGSHLVTRLNLWPPESLWATGWGYGVLQYRSMLYFFVSLIIGLSLAAMIVPIALNPKPLTRGLKALRTTGESERGLMSPKVLLLVYLASSIALALVIWSLTNFDFPIWLLLLFVLGGSFFANYIATASSGVTFSGVGVPYLRELTVFYSGYPKRDIWFTPMPLSISGSIAYVGAASSVMSVPLGGSAFAQGLFQADLLNVRHKDYVKAFFVLMALTLLSSFLFTNLFWFVAGIPSSAYPATVILWPVDALNWARMQVWVWFGYLFNLNWIGLGFGLGAAIAVVTHFLNFPYFLVTLITGTMLWPVAIPVAFAQLLSSVIVQKWIAPSFGAENWARYRGLVVMGYLLGDGLMETIRAVIILATKSGWLLPF